MLKGLTDIFDKAFGVEARAEKEARARERGVQLATALLLIEVAQADYYEDMSEENAVFDLLTISRRANSMSVLLRNHVRGAMPDGVPLGE